MRFWGSGNESYDTDSYTNLLHDDPLSTFLPPWCVPLCPPTCPPSPLVKVSARWVKGLQATAVDRGTNHSISPWKMLAALLDAASLNWEWMDCVVVVASDVFLAFAHFLTTAGCQNRAPIKLQSIEVVGWWIRMCEHFHIYKKIVAYHNLKSNAVKEKQISFKLYS